MSYVGGPGFELYVPVEMTRHVYLALHEAGADLGLKDAGYYALDALRIEAGRRAWGAELGPDETPFEAGLAYAVKLDKPADFIGKAALLKAQGQPLRKKLVTVVLDSRRALRVGRRGAGHRRRGGGRTLVGGLGLQGRALRGSGLPARRRRPTRRTAARRSASTCGASRSLPRPGTTGR